MTKLLAKAFEKASRLSEEMQDSIASQILLDIEGEKMLQKTFESSIVNESALRKDWLTAEEDNAWQDL